MRVEELVTVGSRVINMVGTLMWLLADGAVGKGLATDVFARGFELADAVYLEELRAWAAHGPVEAVAVAVHFWGRGRSRGPGEERVAKRGWGESLLLG